MIIFLNISFTISIFLSILIENIYFSTILISLFSVYMAYLIIKNSVYRKISKTKVSSRIDLYCKEAGIKNDFLIFFILIPNVNYIFEFIFTLENFYNMDFINQFLFILNISIFILMMCFLIKFIYTKIDTKKGIVYKEGLILDNGKLYRFDSVKGYEFINSFEDSGYIDLILTYDEKTIKTMYIHNEDIDKFKALLDKNKVI